MIHEQEQQVTCWYVKHKLNTTDIDIRCWIDKQGALTRTIPKAIQTIDQNTIQITFLRSCNGKVIITPSTRSEQINK